MWEPHSNEPVREGGFSHLVDFRLPVHSMRSEIAQFWRDGLDVIFPRSCVHCGGLPEGGRLRHLCPACDRMLFVVAPPHCTTCGQVNVLLGAYSAGSCAR